MRLTAIALIVSLFSLTAGNAFAQEGSIWRKVAETIPLGSKIKVQLIDGKRVGGTLMRVDDSGVLVKKNNRVPEAAITVTYEQMGNIERDHGGGGAHWAKVLGAGLAAGAGAIVTIFVIALQFD